MKLCFSANLPIKHMHIQIILKTNYNIFLQRHSEFSSPIKRINLRESLSLREFFINGKSIPSTCSREKLMIMAHLNHPSKLACVFVRCLYRPNYANKHCLLGIFLNMKLFLKVIQKCNYKSKQNNIKLFSQPSNVLGKPRYINHEKYHSIVSLRNIFEIKKVFFQNTIRSISMRLWKQNFFLNFMCSNAKFS